MFGKYVRGVSPINTSSANAIAIQAALDKGGDVFIKGNSGDVIKLDRTLVIGSNTKLSAAKGVIFRLDDQATNVLISNAASRQPYIGCTATYDQPSDTYTVISVDHDLFYFDFVLMEGATEPYLRGIFEVYGITKDTFSLRMRQTSNQLASGAVAGSLTYKKADINIEIDNLIIDAYLLFQAGIRSSVVEFSAVHSANIANIRSFRQVVASHAICLAGVSHVKIDNCLAVGNQFVTVYGPANDIVIDRISSGSPINLVKFCTLETAADSAYQATNGGNIFNCSLSNISGVSGYLAQFLHKNFNNGVISNISFKNITVNSNQPFYFDTTDANHLSEIQQITFDNLASSNVLQLFQLGSFNKVSASVIVNNPKFNPYDQYSYFISLQDKASVLFAEVHGGLFEKGAALLYVPATVSHCRASFNNCDIVDLDELFNISNVATQVCVANCRTTGTGTNLFTAGAAGKTTYISLKDCRIATVLTNFINVSSTGTLHVFIDNCLLTNALTNFINILATTGSPTVNIYCSNRFSFTSTTLVNFSGSTPVINSWGYGFVVDVGLLSLTKGQTAWHSSTVAGRNAANQQGPAICNGSNWYAVGTGVGGINTLIV